MSSYHLNCATPEDLHQRFLAVWREFRKSPAAPLLIIVPEPSHAAAWKHRLLESGETIFNTQLMTPGRLRLHLTEALGLGNELLLGREAMRFLLEQTAAKQEDLSPLWQSLARDARPLLQTMDELENSGYRLRDLPDFPGFREWLKEWNQIPLQLRGRANRDEALLAAAKKAPHAFPGGIIFLGLDLNHLRFANVLESALRLYESQAVLTLAPGIEDEALQFVWQQKIDSWIPNARQELDNEALELTSLTSTPESHFFYTPTRGSEIELITRWIRSELSNATPETRIAVVFPGPTSLASAVMDRLRHDSIPFHTPFPTPIPHDTQVRTLLAWCELQSETPTLPLLLNFWEAVQEFPGFAQGLGTDPLSFEVLRQAAQSAFEKFPSVACSALELPPSASRLLSRLQGDLAWPESTTVSDFAQRLESDLSTWIGSKESLGLQEFLHTALTPLAELWKEPVQKRKFSALIRQLFERPDSLPTASAWAPVHLIPPAAATLLRWDALLIAQLNEGDWPAIAHPVSLLREATRETLNTKARKLDPTGAHESIFSPNLSPLLTDGMRYQIERARFSLLRTAASRIAFTASHWDEIESHRELYPSEFYRESWNLFHPNHPWSDAVPAALQALAPTPAAPDSEISDDFSHAYHERRNSQKPFSEYQFCLKSSALPAPLSASQAEKILQDPATAWFSALLNISPPLRDWTADKVLPLYNGKILHGWIRQSFEKIRTPGEFAPLPEAQTWESALRAEIQKTKIAFHAHWPQAPHWWISEWPRLETAALHLLQGVYEFLRAQSCCYLACEYRLRRPLLRPIPGFPVDQLWVGRLDLIALDKPVWEEAEEAVILDFKTGRGAKDFSEGTLLQSAAHFQLAFYAALARQQHPGNLKTSVAILTRHPKMNPELVPIQPLSPSYEPLWKVLAAAWTQGQCGQTLPVRNRFGPHSYLPQATLEIPSFLLHSKWANSESLATWERST